MSQAISLLIAISLIGLVCLWRGYEWGVKETEKRWSDAVARADYSRNNPTSTAARSALKDGKG